MALVSRVMLAGGGTVLPEVSRVVVRTRGRRQGGMRGARDRWMERRGAAEGAQMD
jgi:hypothetical protein